MNTKIKSVVMVCVCSSMVLTAFAACPPADLTGDCKVNLADFVIMTSGWLDEGEPYPILNGMTWVSIRDAGTGGGYEGFTGEIGKYETTNAYYCQFLNNALASGDIIIEGNYVLGANGSSPGADFVGQYYYNIAGAGLTYNGATNGAAARIYYSGGIFTIDSGFENHPVTWVSWYGATAFCNYYGYRLPAEWEWQAVADYDGTFTYGCGTGINNSIANYNGSTHPDGTTVVSSVGKPLGYGYEMCDMAGNASEWTSSLWNPSLSSRVFRGGSWNNYAYRCEVSFRYYESPHIMSHFLGFRVCR